MERDAGCVASDVKAQHWALLVGNLRKDSVVLILEVDVESLRDPLD